MILSIFLFVSSLEWSFVYFLYFQLLEGNTYHLDNKLIEIFSKRSIDGLRKIASEYRKVCKTSAFYYMGKRLVFSKMSSLFKYLWPLCGHQDFKGQQAVWKVSVFGVLLVRIQYECGKVRTRKTKTDTFHALRVIASTLQYLPRLWFKFSRIHRTKNVELRSSM